MARYKVIRKAKLKPRAHNGSEFGDYADWQHGERVPLVDGDPQEPQWSGLYDAKGQPLYRMPEKVGF